MSDVKVWNKLNLENKVRFRHFPTDMVLRALFSNNYFSLNNVKEGGSVLDIGCLYGNNLVPFSDRGWKLFGTEVTPESVEIAKSSCDLQAINGDIKLGFNTELPFETGKFDVLLSIATIHYEESLTAVSDALREMSRVLKDDGCAIIQTAAPGHGIFKNSKKIGQHLYQLNMKKDIRDGQKFIFFENSDDFINLAKKYFRNIEVARCAETYPNQCIDVWLFKLGKV
jgi:SAM-dependent methyltransferase